MKIRELFLRAIAGCALGAVACVQTPCPCRSPEPATTAVAQKPKLAAPFAPKPLLVWDGEGVGSGGQGWSSCQQGTGCTATLEVKHGAGHDGGNGIEFNAAGPEWMGFGWNWFAWYPATAGDDISPYKSLALWIEVDGAPDQKPEPETIKVSLSGSARGGKDDTESVPINDYAPGFTDGAWHRVVLLTRRRVDTPMLTA
jgi:hypothetical protein